MKIDIFTLCDSAQEYNGKLVIIGTFNNISAPQFPALHPGFSLVARIIFDETEKGIHQINFSIKKNDADIYIMPPEQMTADTTETQGKDATINIVAKGDDIVIPAAGSYTVSLKVDGKTWESELNVTQSPKE